MRDRPPPFTAPVRAPSSRGRKGTLRVCGNHVERRDQLREGPRCERAAGSATAAYEGVRAFAARTATALASATGSIGLVRRI